MSQLNFQFAPTEKKGYCTDPDYLEILKEQLSSFGICEMSLKDIDRFLSLLAHDLWKRPEVLVISNESKYIFKDGEVKK